MGGLSTAMVLGVMIIVVAAVIARLGPDLGELLAH
jgi:hypothetical protein